ncbi:MAG: hypothetical protein M3Y31_09230, partial [Gemmatimonadota bacterium]|nr:hypothetical protein [Gemmatimonadota bacterium]
MRTIIVVLALACGAALPAAAQDWNTPAARELVQRAVERRRTAQADSSLQSYSTIAHGFVFFLAQVGEQLEEPPRLAKADELRVQVYWKAPNRTKQVILGWRDGSWLPSDIEYHRDHLGIVTNNFGDQIRLGEGDEVRDVVHPFSPEGVTLYDFALRDSLTIRSPAGELRVLEVQVRPKDFGWPAVIGTGYIDAATAELVRFRFSFTPAAYRDSDLEDISVVLENSLWEGRYWLPYRQEIEIRRRWTMLDFPARGVIRGRWEIDDYDFDTEIPDAMFTGPAIAGLQSASTPDSAFGGEPLEAAVADVATPVNEQDMAALRVEVERIAGTRALGGLPQRRLAAGSLSDLARVNRVQGLTLGFGVAFGVARSRLELRPYLAYGTADERLTGSLSARLGAGATTVEVGASRRVQDFAEWPVISPILNSVLAQEFGDDYGDYLLLERVSVGASHRVDGRSRVTGQLAVERSESVSASAEPANGEYRPNPALGAGTYRVVRLGIERAGSGIVTGRDLRGTMQVEVGDGPTGYVRGAGQVRWLEDFGPVELLTRVGGGAGSSGMPAYRAFALGGRGTLVGEPFRAWGGRKALLGHAELRFEVPVPQIRLGSFASTGRTLTLAPFAA